MENQASIRVASMTYGKIGTLETTSTNTKGAYEVRSMIYPALTTTKQTQAILSFVQLETWILVRIRGLACEATGRAEVVEYQ